LRRYRPGGYGNMVASEDGTYVYWSDADIIISAERVAREKAERERDEALKWHKIAMEQVAVRDRQVEKAEAELADLRVRVYRATKLLIAAKECTTACTDWHGKVFDVLSILTGQSKGGDPDNSRSDEAGPGPDIAQPARDGDEPPAPAATCADCGLGYDDPGFCDLVVPNDVWAKIAPRDGDGLLCPTCMCRAAHRAGIQDAPAIFRSGPFSVPTRASDGIAELVEKREAAIREMLTALETLNNWPNPFNRVSDAAVRAQFIPALKAARAAGIKGSADDA
jgi:hypothetical protein